MLRHCPKNIPRGHSLDTKPLRGKVSYVLSGSVGLSGTRNYLTFGSQAEVRIKEATEPRGIWANGCFEEGIRTSKGLLEDEIRTSRKKGVRGVIRSLGKNDTLRRESGPQDTSRGENKDLEIKGAS